MLTKILDKSAKIAVVDNSGSTRQLLSETMKSFGFVQIHGMANIKDVVEFLETDALDIVICNLESGGEFNALSLLTLCTQNPDLRHIRVCLIIEEEEEYCLQAAYSLGLAAHIMKPFTKDNLKEEVTRFTSFVEQYNAIEPLVAAEYIRPILKKANDLQTWLEFEKKLLSLYPGSTHLLLSMAEPLFLSGKKAEAVGVLKQSMLIEPKFETKASELFKGYAEEGETLKTAVSTDEFNALGLERVVVVDKDETIQTTLKDVLKNVGVKDIQCFSDGEAAAHWIAENPDPQLIIQEWKIPKLNGPMFVQRVSKAGGTNSVIVVLSSLVQPKDLPLVKEMGIVNIIEKPFDKSEFVKSIIWTLQQERTPTELSSQEIKIRRLLRARKKEEAEQLIARFMENPKISEARKLLMQAELDFVNRDYEAVKVKCMMALKTSTDSVNALSLLGKALMQLRDFDSALKCLEKAQSMSPQNIERLCNIAEAESELGSEKKAEEDLEQAADLDPSNPVVAETGVKLAMNNNDLNKAKEIMETLASLENMIAQMNNRAVALARVDRVDESLEQYEKAVKSLPDSKPILKSLVLYNLALALIKAGKLEEGKQKLEEALANPSNKIKAKAASLKSRIEAALSSGGALQLMSGNADSKAPIEAAGGDVVQLKPFHVTEIMTNPGDMGCYLIYNATKHDAKTLALLSKRFDFTVRTGISREETRKVS